MNKTEYYAEINRLLEKRDIQGIIDFRKENASDFPLPENWDDLMVELAITEENE